MPGPFEVTLTRIFLRNPDRVQIEDKIVTFREPQYDLVPTRESLASVQPVLEGPNDSIP